ncbi:hypothetical protein GCM10010965_23070 [Caldalkalibacillus thermarum]|uniref:hypothetical protein n=1 Tax=Caldalkalibacillus thermarum TaxID=296745 RepID=UPI00166DDA76|nr:hypothetical protein [Caldalkalibacillus thermarum]GGK29604.1 hypothetical protein GCM10010965_23070 [Caldalkalibacillus thermarum]
MENQYQGSYLNERNHPQQPFHHFPFAHHYPYHHYPMHHYPMWHHYPWHHHHFYPHYPYPHHMYHHVPGHAYHREFQANEGELLDREQSDVEDTTK